MAVLCGMPTLQYSSRSARLSVHKLCTSCIRRCLVSRASDWVMSALSVVLPISSFQFTSVSQAAQRRTWFTQYRTSDVTENLGRFLVRSVHVRRLTLIPAVKIETRHPVEGSFNSEFPSIYNQCGVMNAWSRETLNIFEKFWRFLEKRPITVKFWKLCSESFHRLADRRVVCKSREIWPTGNG